MSIGDAPYRCVPILILLACALLLPSTALALQLGGSLSWTTTRTETNTPTTDSVQTGFGQTYRTNANGGFLRPGLLNWTAGVGWRRDMTTFSGVNQPARDVRLTDYNLGFVVLPTVMPLNINLRRSVVDNSSGSGKQTTETGTISLSTRIPMPDGEPLGVSAFQSEQDATGGTTTSRLLGLSKRFEIGSGTDLNSSYQLSQYSAPGTRSTGHGASLSTNTVWNERLSTNAFANVSSRSTTSTRNASGRSLFLNNSLGAGLFYRRARTLSASLNYAYSESPQDQGEDIRSQLLSGRGNLRLSKKTDVNGSFALRRLDLNTTRLDTVTARAGLKYRPRFGWSTGGQVSVSSNTTSGASSSDRNAYTVNGFLNARHDLVPVRLNWGSSLSWSSSSGTFSEDRLTTNAHVSVSEQQLRWVRLNANYRFTDIQQSYGSGGVEPFTQDHGVGLSASLTPKRRVLLPTDSLSASASTSATWSRQFRADRNLRSTSFNLHGSYTAWSGLVADASYRFVDNSSDTTGSEHLFLAAATWSRTALRRGKMRLKADARRSYTGGNLESEEYGITYYFDYSIGLLRASFSANYTSLTLGQGDGTDTNGVRLNITRTF
ncbi:MAG: hypothetical protein ACE5FN_02780 [Leptospirillia bacterium]